MKNLFILFSSLLIMFSCESINYGGSSKKYLLYKIEKIEILNNWYIIYGIQEDKKYKIVSKKVELSEHGKCKLIKEGETYKLILHPRNEKPPIINGIKLQPQNNLDVQCYTFDINTQICIDPDKDINTLYFTDNLRGLCYVQN